MYRISLVLTLLASIAFSCDTPARAEPTASAMADAAQRFLASLDAKQKARAAFSFDSPERFNWHWIPRARKGLPFKDLTSEQRPLAFGLLSTGLSKKGYLRATTTMSLEAILRIDEHGTGPVRDPELYFLSVFGTPSDDGEWGWRVEGHHLALNFTLKGGQVISATPFMFGSNPAEVQTGTRKGLRNMAEIEDPAHALLRSLTPEQRKSAVVRDKAPDVTTTPNPAQAPRTVPAGIASTQLNSTQRETLTRLLHAYAANFPAPIGDELLDQITRGEQSAHFAWFGPADPRKPHSFTIQGSTFFIDFNDTQNETNHIHTFYRSLLGDFGVPVGK